MSEMIQNRRTVEKKEERFDLFSSFLDANDDPDDPDTLTDRELMGNVFIFLFAGDDLLASFDLIKCSRIVFRARVDRSYPLLYFCYAGAIPRNTGGII